MAAGPLISAVIPVYNGAQFIVAAIESVFAQDYRPLEVIVIDDGSDDGTPRVASRFPGVRIESQTRQGAGSARNAGAAISRGDFLAFLDADDVWTPRKLVSQMAVFQTQPDIEAVFGFAREFRDGDDPFENDRAGVAAPIPGTMLIRREAFERIGSFDIAADAREGVDWYLRALELSLRSHMLREIVYCRRIHGRNRGILNPNPAGYVQAIKASLDRRRRDGTVRSHAQRIGT